MTHMLSASTMIGDSVVNPAGEDLGKIEELMLDTEGGNVAYAVLSFGGFLGMGEKLFAIPWQQLTLDEPGERFVLHLSREVLEGAPGFDKDNWPNFADTGWNEEITAYYGAAA